MTLHPLYLLLQNDFKWKWGVAQAKALAASKNLLTSDKYLMHFDSSLKLTLTCDASAYGSHKMPDGSGRPISYSSCTLKKVLHASLALRKSQ